MAPSRREHLAMCRRIWAVCRLATPQEIRDGLSFYPGAYGLCRLFSRLHPELSPRHVAGIYAALSPLNTWDTNVANILAVLRFWSIARVNTTDANLHKALRIRCGADPESVLSGRKVLSFFRCISAPDDWTLPPAIDRHMFNLALGLHRPTKREQGNIANNPILYSRVESAFLDMGRREGIGNRLASICWFVQRRLERTGQRALEHAGGPIPPLPGPTCCGRPMQAHARHPRQRWYCTRCRSTHIPTLCLRIVRTPSGWVQQTSTHGLKLWHDQRGRTCVTLPKQHPYATSAGYQRLARFLIAEELGYLPPSSQHTHHTRGLDDDSLRSLELLDVSYHGRIHASALYVARDIAGRFIPVADPAAHGGIFPWPRRGPILGRAARG